MHIDLNMYIYIQIYAFIRYVRGIIATQKCKEWKASRSVVKIHVCVGLCRSVSQVVPVVN